MATGQHTQRAFVALGSNMGDRVAMIEEACREMEDRGIKIKRTSSLFETAPMYVIETSKSPMELLDTLQSIEIDMGRRKVIDKGPRNIDLDILLYGDSAVSNDRLIVPHKLMLEREFVLRPLCQLIPDEHPLVEGKDKTYTSHLQALPPSNPPPVAMIPMPAGLPPITPTNPSRSTLLMAVLNVTPDSFSDGGTHSSTDPTALLATVKAYIQAGVSIIDVGGESTRPNAEPVTEAEELSRVIPAIKLIRSLPEASKVAISIDTYRAAVAEAAVNAGADIINDISAGLLDPDMLPTMAQLQKTVMLSHTRGTPKTMNKLTHYPDGVLAGIQAELAERIRAAEQAGVRRWRIIADPGVGFAKTQDQNLTILRNLDHLRQAEELQYMPWLLGVSRKGFIGHITGVKRADERAWGTAAAVTAAIGGGADIVRVHDVKEMSQVTRMADAIYRPNL
ncbi:folic acid synthesis protein [Nannizzia gypsea CBS 118893]|uniref:Folic acid synthesis protein FOL1 n=1 Tax=Arthroderma gypseum (strain ATCC MYA-4604 / CBS 118893) TaxID=535722 RepID=E4V514_ARTGP|nr:folic acid synthesis protein [Nannizzia gypsea CBS 118893]EFR05088.1 folic acid synthesis protein [Nannizzia gypsea CBS 118893]